MGSLHDRAEALGLEKTARWLRWLDKLDALCPGGETFGNMQECADCEFGPSCDMGDHEPHLIECIEALERYRERAEKAEAELGRVTRPMPPPAPGSQTWTPHDERWREIL